MEEEEDEEVEAQKEKDEEEVAIDGRHLPFVLPARREKLVFSRCVLWTRDGWGVPA